jgi:Periplasmic component of the Tol biopolymer transport system
MRLPAFAIAGSIAVVALAVAACGNDDNAPTSATSVSAAHTNSPATATPLATVCVNGGQAMFKVDVSTGAVTTIGHGAFPVWSADSRFIAYFVAPGQAGVPNCNQGLVVQAAGSLQPLFVVPGVSTEHVWSPADDMIATGGNGTADDYATLASGFDHGDITTKQLYHGRVGAITWSPNGQRFAFANEDTADVLVYDVANGHLTTIPSPVQGEKVAVSEIAFSPDGNHLAYVPYVYGHTGPDTMHIFVASLQGGVTHEVPATASIKQLHWTADGVDILFVDDIAWAIYSVPADGSSAPQTIAEKASGIIPSPDGSHIAFIADPCGDNYGIATIAPDGSGRHVVVPGVGLAREALIWSPTGDRIAFSSDATYTVAPDGSGEKRITNPMEALKWSPDGRYLLGEELAGIGGEPCHYESR